MRLLLSTRNEHKRREFARLMPGFDIETLPDSVVLPPEDGDTFEHNAVVKARAAAAATGRVAIADDSGIEAAALGGRPGVRSARYAGERATDEENLSKLVAEAPEGSRLRYVCALAFVDPADGVERIFEGTCEGTLAGRRRGERGFGYDPVFLPDEQPGALAVAQPGAETRAADTPAAFSAGADTPAVSADGSNGVLTMAELSDAQKDAISHRGRAARALIAWLRESRAG